MEAWRAYLELALGLTEASRKKAQKAAKKLVGKGGATAGQLQAMAEELVATSAANRDALTKLVRFEVDRALGRVGLATAEEVADLTARVRELEEQLRAASATPAPATPAKVVATAPVEAAAKATPATSAPTVAPTPASAKAAPTPAKKAVAKKDVAKKAVAKKTVAKKASPQKASPPAPTAEKAVAKKTVAKKTVARKSTPDEPATPPAGGVE